MRSAIFTALLALTACGAVDPLTAARLAALSPLNADPAAVAVRLDLPPGIALPPGGARLTLAAESPDGRTVSQTVRLAADGPVLAIAAADRPALAAAQAEIRALKAEDPATRGSLSLALSPCRMGAGPAPDARAGAAVRLAANEAFLPLVTDAPLSDVLDPAATGELPPCPGQPR